MKGWKLPPNTVSVCRPGRWGNPFKVGQDMPGMPGVKMDAFDAVHCFRLFIPDFAREAARKELRGRNLACFCALDQPCHADVLLELANGTDGQGALK
ncbi:DUF4326 domain-containing protein [Bradyrhizobium japonicum]|uniref:DUF4326 domain-containing protein n=1 Tax=Bradyrhizobium japonicum TaxID=375 RepID=UPI00200D244A|nr:DUF4326 domain-containing protein [Bradyrhizobium japonicum]UQD69192.1 DUF4326 domain-containing protein [Bradyrhizobium japonicum]WAX24454.1 DUF4326 domain-containing protein [Bradyrhizobium phage ppBjS10J-1]